MLGVWYTSVNFGLSGSLSFLKLTYIRQLWSGKDVSPFQRDAARISPALAFAFRVEGFGLRVQVLGFEV